MSMTIVLRIISTALWLIVANLLFFNFEPGGRYLILVEAVITGFSAGAIRSLTGPFMDRRLQSLLCAGGIIFGLGLTRLIFQGITLAIPGVLLVYLGLMLVEMILPEKITDSRLQSTE